MATNNIVNYDDKRFTEVEADKKAALNEVDVTYGNMINNTDKYYQQQIDAANNYAEQQKKIQQEQTDFAIEQINQQKAQAKQDYTKEQSGAYVDWQKQSNQYGVNAEQMAAQGMQNTGYSESSQVSMYNTYQNRVATARESYNRAVLNYDNAIKDARLQNNAALAEIAYNALQKQLELSLEGFQYKNTLIIAKSDKELAVDDMYYGRYQDVLQQINTENAMAEEVRQYNEKMALEQAKLAEEKRQYNKTLEEEKRQFEVLNNDSGNNGGGGKKTTTYKVAYNSKAKNPSQSYTVVTPKNTNSKNASSDSDATAYLNGLIKSGASKDKVANEISIALRDGAITKAEATSLRNKFTPRGVQY